MQADLLHASKGLDVQRYRGAEVWRYQDEGGGRIWKPDKVQVQKCNMMISLEI
jgi:hypothetical protein